MTSSAPAPWLDADDDLRNPLILDSGLGHKDFGRAARDSEVASAHVEVAQERGAASVMTDDGNQSADQTAHNNLKQHRKK